ncbi:MAG: prenyltransferase/squalene oxidase repeat-containing protein [Gemmataceae bacterium]
MRRRLVVPIVVVALAAALAANSSARQPQAKGKAALSPKEQWAKAVERGVAYLKARQAEDGTWSKAASPGVTGIVLTGLLKCGVAPDDPVVAKGLKFVESQVDETTGHIAGPNARLGLHNYGTCVNLTALALADRDGKYKAVVTRAADFLKQLQWDESEGKSPADPIYGGAGYGGGSRPDMSNTSFFLDALGVAGVPKTDPAFKKAVVYVSRSQNLKSEFNDQPWAGTINDGSFIYTASGDTRGDTLADGKKPGYGSMTFAGLKGLIQCGVPRDDLRVQKALGWLREHYSVDVNPGMADGSGPRGLYYYLMTMAKALTALGEPTFVDAKGVAHDWKRDITMALANRQQKDGGWANDIAAWMETEPDLCTAYALIALSYCKPAD